MKMKHNIVKKLATTLLATFVAFGAIVAGPATKAEAKWYKSNGAYYYRYDNGKWARDSWVKYKGAYYYCGSDYKVQANAWVDYKGATYHVGKDGKAQANRWVVDGGNYYRLASDGKMMADAWTKYSGTYYHLGNDGAVETNEWVWTNGSWYYVGANGKPYVNATLANGDTTYHFNGAGKYDYKDVKTTEYRSEPSYTHAITGDIIGIDCDTPHYVEGTYVEDPTVYRLEFGHMEGPDFEHLEFVVDEYVDGVTLGKYYVDAEDLAVDPAPIPNRWFGPNSDLALNVIYALPDGPERDRLLGLCDKYLAISATITHGGRLTYECDCRFVTEDAESLYMRTHFYDGYDELTQTRNRTIKYSGADVDRFLEEYMVYQEKYNHNYWDPRDVTKTLGIQDPYEVPITRWFYAATWAYHTTTRYYVNGTSKVVSTSTTVTFF